MSNLFSFIKREIVAAIAGFILILILILFSGCVKRPVTPPESLDYGFSCRAEFSYKDMKILLEINKHSLLKYEFKVLSPPELKGLSVIYDGENAKISYLGLTYDLFAENLPDASFASAFKNCLEDASRVMPKDYQKNGDTEIYSGRCGSGAYSIELQSGNLTRIILPEISIDANIFNFIKN